MDNPLLLMRYLLLLVLFAPLLGALAVLVLGRSSTDRARRAATWHALLHMGFTLVLILFGMENLSSRAAVHSMDRVQAQQTFQPTAVPGDPGNGVSEDESGRTAWSLLTFQSSREDHLREMPSSDVQFYVGIDGINLWLIALTSLMTFVAVQISWKSIRENAAGYYAWLFVLQTGIIGVFVSFDVILFYVFFELTLIPAFFLIGSWGVGGGRRDAARRFVLYTLFGSLLTLTGVVGIVLNNPTPVHRLQDGKQFEFHTIVNLNQLQNQNQRNFEKPEAGPITFSLPQLIKNGTTWATVHRMTPVFLEQQRLRAEQQATELKKQLAVAPANAKLTAELAAAEAIRVQAEAQASIVATEDSRYQAIQTLCFFLLLAGFAVKIPIVPFHTWLPSAYGEAPLAMTMLLSALMAKLGTFGILRLVLPLCPDAAQVYGLPVFGTLGAISIVYGAFCAFAQRDMKMLTAYSSVSHLGFLVIGLFTLTDEGLSGATLHMVNHGLATGAMFAMFAFLLERYRTLDMNQYSGLWAKYPGYTVIFFVICLASIGLPGLNNFISEMLMLGGIFHPTNESATATMLGVAAIFGILLSAWYILTMLRRVIYGPLREPPAATENPKDVSLREVVAFGLPALCCLVIGLYPQPIINTMQADLSVVSDLAKQAQDRIDLSNHKWNATPLPHE